ncbi:unnamed protein product, partial [Brassica rapa subsp. trilocularis]
KPKRRGWRRERRERNQKVYGVVLLSRMSSRWSWHGKEKPDGIPERLFATDRYPSERVNMYSTVDHLLAARDALNNIPEMVKLIGS